MSLRKVATGLVTIGFAAGLVGAGVSATYTDQVTAQANAVYVGSFACQLSTATPGAVVTDNGHTVTFTEPDITQSAPQQGGNALDLSITLTNTGSIAQNVHWTITGPDYNIAPYNRPPYNSPNGHFGTSAGSPSMLTDLHNFTGSQTYNSLGFMWLTPLDNTDLGVSLTATYHADCTEYSAPPPAQRPSYVAGASIGGATLALPTGWLPGDLAIAMTWKGGTSGVGPIPAGFTSIYGFGTTSYKSSIAQRVLQAGDTSFTATGALGFEILIYRHAAVAMNGGLALVGGANATTGSTFSCYSPTNGPMPTDGTGVVVCMAGDTVAANIKDMAVTGPPALVNRSSGFADNMGGADTAGTVVTSWPAPGTVIGTFVATGANRSHGTLDVGLVYAP